MVILFHSSVLFGFWIGTTDTESFATLHQHSTVWFVLERMHGHSREWPILGNENVGIIMHTITLRIHKTIVT